MKLRPKASRVPRSDTLSGETERHQSNQTCVGRMERNGCGQTVPANGLHMFERIAKSWLMAFEPLGGNRKVVTLLA